MASSCIARETSRLTMERGISNSAAKASASASSRSEAPSRQLTRLSKLSTYTS